MKFGFDTYRCTQKAQKILHEIPICTLSIYTKLQGRDIFPDQSFLCAQAALQKCQHLSHPFLEIKVGASSARLKIHAAIYLMLRKKLSSLIELLLFALIAFVSSPRLPKASTAPWTVPSPAGRSMLCSCNGILGANDSGCRRACFRSRLAANRLCFLDFAIGRLELAQIIRRKVWG